MNLKTVVSIIIISFITGGVFLYITSRFDVSSRPNVTSTVLLISPKPIPTEFSSIENVEKKKILDNKKSTYINGIYTNYKLGIELRIDNNLSMDECGDMSCVSFGVNKIRIDNMNPYGNKKENFNSRILRTDLMCSAGGPMGSIDCTNIEVRDYVNQNNISGYMVMREIDSTGNADMGTDHAYVFINSFLNDDSIIIIQAESHSELDLNLLDNVVKTLKFL